jgi:hypothetical protein
MFFPAGTIRILPATKTLWHYSGFYCCLKYKSPIAIIGNRDGNALHLEEHKGGSICTNCKPAAFFDGVQKNDTISGIWITVDSTRSLPFSVVKKRLDKKIIFALASRRNVGT